MSELMHLLVGAELGFVTVRIGDVHVVVVTVLRLRDSTLDVLAFPRYGEH